MFRKFTVLTICFLCVALLLSSVAFAVEKTEDSVPAATAMKTAPVYHTPDRAVDIYQAFEARSFTASDNTTLQYRIFIPDGYTPEADYPLMLILHGAGERGNDNSAQMRNAVQNLFNDLTSPIYGSIVVCPQCPDNNQWVDTPWSNGNYSIANVPESNELKAVLEILDSVKAEYAVDESRVYGMGLSMGGFGIWDLMMRHPDVLTAGVPLCGGADASCAQRLVDKPIWTIHGDADGIVPVSGTRAMVQAIQSAGGDSIVYEELKGYGHNVWDYGSTREGLMNWLFAQISPCETHTDQYIDNGDGTHRHTCSVCGTVIAKSQAHTGVDDGDCTTALTCVCGAVLTAAKSHDFTGAFESDETGHWQVCANENCTAVGAKQEHTGGEATYFDKAICTVCGRAYGDTLVDKTAPAGKMECGKTSLIGTGGELFFQESLLVSLSASDTESGVDTIEYFVSNDQPEAPDDISSWTAYTAPFSLNQSGRYVLYARLTDKAGNSAVIHSDAIVLDDTAPVISGVEDGKSYCDAVSVEIADDYLDTVTLDGNPVTLTNGRITLSYAQRAQTLVATDKAGNSTTVKTTVHNGHVWDAGTVIAAATTEKEGQIEHVCAHCGRTELKTIPKISGAGTDNGRTPSVAENIYPKTGDTHLLLPWMTAALASAGILALMVVKKKKEDA